MNIVTVVFFLLLIWIQVFVCLRININPTDKLILLSSNPDANSFHKFIKTLFENESFWPVLVAFQQARYYNFAPAFGNFLRFSKCPELLEIVAKEEFPARELLNAEILNFEGLDACFSKLPLDFFENRLQFNPIESRNFKTSQWRVFKSIEFIKMAYFSPKLTTNWYSWAIEGHVLLGKRSCTSCFPYLTWPWIWKLLNFLTINILPEDLIAQFVETVCSNYEMSVTSFLARGHNTFQSNLLHLINMRRSTAYSQEDLAFSQTQIMSTITMTAVLLGYSGDGHVFNRSRAFLSNSLKILKTNAGRQVLLKKELKLFVENLLKNHQKLELLTFSQLEKCLLLFASVITKGSPLGPWLLNIFYIWSYYYKDPFEGAIISFMEPFTTIFFAEESLVTASDTCLLFKSTNSFINEEVDDDFFVTRRIVNKHFIHRRSLAREVYKECPEEIPSDNRRNSDLFPLKIRLQDLFMKSRFIPSFAPVPMCFEMKMSPGHVCVSIFKEINARQIHSVPLPMNLKILSRNAGYIDNLVALLRMFFRSLKATSSWFSVSYYEGEDVTDLRPILLPTLRLPPHFMEYIGILLGQAVVSNVACPFLFDKNYFSLLAKNDLDCKSIEVQDIYPQETINEHSTDRQTLRVFESCNLSAVKVFENIQNSLKMYGTVSLHPIKPEPKTFTIPTKNMDKILTMSVARLKHGLNRFIPTDSFTSEELFHLIFKQ